MNAAVWVFCLVVLTGCQVKVTLGDVIECSKVVELTLRDDTEEGYVMFNISSKVQPNDDCKYMNVSDDLRSIVLTRNLTTNCNNLVFCNFGCLGEKDAFLRIALTIQRTRPYTLLFRNDNYVADVRELSNVDTKVDITPGINVSVSECEDYTVKGAEFTLKGGRGLLEWGTATYYDSLEVSGNIDYEQNKTFDLTLSCLVPSLNATASTTIHVNVSDVDDQDPIFNENIYYLNITEENSTMVNIGMITSPPVYAYDQDIGINSPVYYSIRAQAISGLFKINNTTGYISVTKPLNRETVTSYSILIEATQTDNEFRTATATVSVSVLDIDDHSPEFEKDRYSASINEHAAVNTTIVIVRATDLDEGDNAKFSYQIGNASVPVTIDANSGTMVVADSQAFDRESYEQGILNVLVEAVPFKPGPNGTTLVTITLIDINDNSPNFTQQDYTFTAIDGDNFDVIGMVSAEDGDEGPNANVTYDIVRSSQTSQDCPENQNMNQFPFVVGSLSGNVTVDGLPACESYTALVEACDNPLVSSLRRCSVASMHINHNSSSEVRNISQDLSVAENSPNGTLVGIIQCPRGNAFHIMADRPFRIDASSGMILTNDVLDRENTSIQLLSVEAKHNMKTKCFVNVTIHVSDDNDNVPVFINTSGYVFNLPSDAAVRLGSVQATDSDDGQNAVVGYYLQNQRQTAFSINNTNGEITTSGNENLDIDIVRILVVAEDNGIPTLRTTESVYILPTEQPAELIPIKTSLPKSEINDRKADIESQLLQVTGVPFTIKDILQKKTGSMIQLEYLNKTLSRRTVLSTVVDNYEAIRSMFYSSQKRRADTVDGSKFGTTEIGLIVLAAVILIGAIVAIVVIRRQCTRAKSYRHLYESLTRNSSIYESQEIKVRMDDEGSQFTTVVADEELERVRNGTVSAVVNPAYEPDDADITDVKTTSFTTQDENANDPKDLDSSEMSVDEAIDSLDQLSDRLEQEDNGNAVVYDNVNTTISEPDEDEINDDRSVFDDAVKTDNEDVDAKDINDTSVDNDNDSDADDDVSNGLAKRILQSKSRSPVMSRRTEDDASIGQGTDGAGQDEEEPNPDYDIKQVRFSTQVLDATENKIEPLKDTKDQADGVGDEKELNQPNEESKQVPVFDNEKTPDKDIEQKEEAEAKEEETGGLMLEEEINSPVDFLTDTGTGEFYFGVPEESTQF